MPATLCHYFHNLEVLKNISCDNIDKDAFVFGGQGPDFLYFHRLSPFQMGKSHRKLGVSLHKTDPDKTLSLMAKYIIRNPNDLTALSYALGFICHYSFDRTAHPYVYSTEKAIIEAEKIRYSRFLVHCRIEHSLDVIMLREKLNIDSTEFNPASILTNDRNVLDGIAKMMNFVINGLYGKDSVNEKNLVKALADMKTNLSHLHDPFLFKRPCLVAIEKVLHLGPAFSCAIRPIMEDGKWDYANVENGEWVSPFDSGVTHSDSFFEIFDLAVVDATNLVNAFLDAVNQGKFEIDFTDKLSYKTGIKMGEMDNE